jgi:hypothetical protein
MPCFRCNACTSQVNKRRVFVNHMGVPRTNDEFRSKSDSDFHHNPSEFERIPEVHMIKQFTIDYLHCALLGIMRRLLKKWFGEKGLYSASRKLRISEKIAKFFQVQPCDFQRHLRSLDKMSLWKGSELRTFVLYVGPCVLENEIAADHFKNFMLFHTALTILTNNQLAVDFNEIAKIIIDEFVEELPLLYGADFVTYNSHIFTHISDDCMTNGSLDNFSAFKFESYIGKLKSLVKSPNNPLAQAYNRLSELTHVSKIKSTKDNNSTKFKLKLKLGGEVYGKCIVNNRSLCNNGKDCFGMLRDKSIVQFLRFRRVAEGVVKADCQKYTNVSNIYDTPIESSDVNCFNVSLKVFELVTCDVRDVILKFYASPPNDDDIIKVFALTKFDD